MHRFSLAIAGMCAVPAQAGEVFAGAYVHEVDTPFTLYTGESGADAELGYRFDPIEQLGAIGKPSPYVIASLNTGGGTSFAGVGLSWKIGKGPVYVRPGVGLVVHDGPSERIDPFTGRHTELGSRVLFEPEIAVGTQVTERVAIEVSWVHISQGRIFNAQQNPGIDMIGVRFNWRL
ncbi:acyloxyacyl hydrolase [Croceibacterium salegens]|nr:acyloxyacyl hydrolase [Croceibacterium salegens]